MPGVARGCDRFPVGGGDPAWTTDCAETTPGPDPGRGAITSKSSLSEKWSSLLTRDSTRPVNLPCPRSRHHRCRGVGMVYSVE